MSRAELADLIRASLGAASVGCVVDIGCGQSEASDAHDACTLFSAGAVLSASGLENMSFYGIDPLLSERVPGFRGTLAEFLDCSEACHPTPDLVLCADALHCMGESASHFARYLSGLYTGTRVVLWDCVRNDGGTPESGAACTLHECKAMIDTELGISHGQLLSQAELLEAIQSTPVHWSVCARVKGRLCSVAELAEACQATLDYAELVAENRRLYTRVARTVRTIALQRDAAYRLEDRLLCIGTVAAESQKQQE